MCELVPQCLASQGKISGRQTIFLSGFAKVRKFFECFPQRLASFWKCSEHVWKSSENLWKSSLNLWEVLKNVCPERYLEKRPYAWWRFVDQLHHHASLPCSFSGTFFPHFMLIFFSIPVLWEHICILNVKLSGKTDQQNVIMHKAHWKKKTNLRKFFGNDWDFWKTFSFCS